MQQDILAKRYVNAFKNSLPEANRAAIIEQSESILSQMVQSAELMNILKNPIVSVEKKANAIKNVAGKFNPPSETMGLLNLLLKKKRGDILPEIAKQLATVLLDIQNRTKAVIRSKNALNEAAKQQVLNFIKGKTKKEIIPYFEEDDSLVGGFEVTMDNKVYDGSILGTIQKLNEKIKI